MQALKKLFNNGYFLIFLAFLLFLGGALLRAPLQAQHKLLVAVEGFKDPNFANTVVLVLRHDMSGAFGLILNPEGSGSGPLNGGPLEKKTTVYVLHSHDVALKGTAFMNDLQMGVAEGGESLEQLAQAKTKPRWSLALNGYAGWGPRQLDREIRHGIWKVIDYDEGLVMRTPRGQMWKKALQMPATGSKDEKSKKESKKEG